MARRLIILAGTVAGRNVRQGELLRKKGKSMKIRKGLNGGQYKPLSDEDVEKIIKQALKSFRKLAYR